MTNSEKCHWCSKPGASTWNSDINPKTMQKRKHRSVQKFCCLKCKTEFDDRYGITWVKTGCFVATAVYNNYDHPVVLDLRFFRDNFLEQKTWGRTFISWYYTHSPNWANIISRSRVLRLIALLLVVKPLHLFVKLVTKNKLR